jgi:hypothetical protein
MTDFATQLQCPKCGAALSHTALYPRWWAYEAFFPDLKVPVARIGGVVLVVGALFALVHPALAAAAVVGIGMWANYRYFAALQCDGCGTYFITGQFDKNAPRTRGDDRKLIRYTVIAAVIISALAVAIYSAQAWYASTCDTNCTAQGLKMDAKSRLFEC